MVKSITLFGIIAGFLTLAMSAALATPSKDEEHTLIIEPGSWEWTHETLIGPAPITSTEVQCVTPEDTKLALSDIADELSAKCSMAEISRIDQGFSFKLSCDGEIKGIANGKLKTTGKTISLSANGAASMFGMTAPFVISAEAKHIGDC